MTRQFVLCISVVRVSAKHRITLITYTFLIRILKIVLKRKMENNFSSRDNRISSLNLKRNRLVRSWPFSLLHPV